MVRNAMKKGLPSDRLQLVDWELSRGGPFRCCTPVWISAASVSTSRSATASASCAGSAPTIATCRSCSLSPGSAGCSPTRSPPRSATSPASPLRASSPATAASAPAVYQSGERDLRGPLSKQGPRYLRWALVEAATHACTAPVYRDRYQQTKTRIGKQRGAKVAQIDLARRLSEAIWYMLTREQPFAPKGATDPLAA